MTALRVFGAQSVRISLTGEIPGNGTFGQVVLDGFADRVRIRVGTAASPSVPEIVAEEAGEQRIFNNASLVRAAIPAENELILLVQGSANSNPGTNAQLYLLNNSVPGTVSSDPERALNWVSYGLFYRRDGTSAPKRLSAFTFGTVTAATDMPTTGISDYTMHVSGQSFFIEPRQGVVEARLSGPPTGSATSTTRVNYATGVVTVGVVFYQFTTSVYDSFSGTGTIQAGTNRFTGTMTSASGATAAFQGYAYGPRAAEIGLVIGVDIGSFGGRPSSAIAAMVGRKR